MNASGIYIDNGSGVAGDMLLGALVDLGLSAAELNEVLHKAIPVKNWRVEVSRTERQGWPARSVRVIGDRPFGSADHMMRTLQRAALPAPVKMNARLVLEHLIKAEKHAHGAAGHAHFDPQGLGLLDTLVDVFGVCWGMWRLGFSEIKASSIHTGRIAPASAAMLEAFRMPAYSNQNQFELATPTGIALLSVLVKEFGPMPAAVLKSAGFGAGQRDIAGRPNVLAIYRLNLTASNDTVHRSAPHGDFLAEQERVVLLETVIDDMDPRLYPHVSEMLMKAGALDVWWVSAGMKKGRPGTAYSVLCRPEHEMRLLKILFTESTTLGVRRLPLERWILPRHSRGIRKVARLPQGGTKSQVEYELARAKALGLSLPLKKLLK